MKKNVYYMHAVSSILFSEKQKIETQQGLFDSNFVLKIYAQNSSQKELLQNISCLILL